MTSGQEMERVYSYNPEARTGRFALLHGSVCVDVRWSGWL